MAQVKRLAPGVLLIVAAITARTVSTQEPGVDRRAIGVFPEHASIGSSRYPIEAAIADGRRLFKTKFNVLDGAGRPESTGDSKPTPRDSRGGAFQRIAGPDASSCAGCHIEPLLGGSGEFVTNTFVGAHLSDPPTASIGADLTNERNTVTLFGSGVVELIAREMTVDLQRQRDAAIASSRRQGGRVSVALSAKSTQFGRITAHPDGYVDYAELEGVDYTLIVRPFGVKGVAASLREFTTFALNQHHGIQALERFGWERTGVHDFDRDGHTVEFSVGQVSALVLFQATLPVPHSYDPEIVRSTGFQVFNSIGCASCHTPLTVLRANVFSEPGPFNRPGALNAAETENIVRVSLDLPEREDGYAVAMYSDLKRHRMCDNEVRHFCNERLRQDNVPQELFMTLRLWDLATSAPYCHRGDCSTVTEAILAHGGEARAARDRFIDLPASSRRSLIDFLLSLGARQIAPD
jgi:hypothetical protein